MVSRGSRAKEGRRAASSKRDATCETRRAQDRGELEEVDSKSEGDRFVAPPPTTQRACDETVAQSHGARKQPLARCGGDRGSVQA